MSDMYTDGWVIFGQSLSPGLEDLGDSGVVAEGAVDLGLGEDVLVTSSSISVAEGSQLLLSQGDQLVLFLRGDLAELLDSPVDGLQDEGEDGVLGVVHLALSNTFKSQFEDISFDFSLVLLVGDIDALEGLLHDGRDDLVLVDCLKGLGLTENALGTSVKVVLESQLLGDEELHGKNDTLRRVLLRMER